MNSKEFNVSISVKQNNAVIIRGVIQNDTADLFNIQLTDGTVPFDFIGFDQVVVMTLLPDGETMYADGLKETDIIDPEIGLIAFHLPVELTETVGMHYMTISIYGGGKMLQSARLNYYVDESYDDLYEQYAQDAERIARLDVLTQALTKISNMQSTLDGYAVAEAIRQSQEQARVDTTNGLLAQMQDLYEQAQAMVESAQQTWQSTVDVYNPVKAIAAVGTGVVMYDENWLYEYDGFSEENPSVLEPEEGVAYQIMAQFDVDEQDLQPSSIAGMRFLWNRTMYVVEQTPVLAGFVTRAEIATINGSDKTIKIKTGAASSLASLSVGELGYATDSGALYIGTGSGAVQLVPENSPFVISDTAPIDTSLIWIDAGHSNVIKVYDSVDQEWISTNPGTAVFG